MTGETEIVRYIYGVDPGRLAGVALLGVDAAGNVRILHLATIEMGGSTLHIARAVRFCISARGIQGPATRHGGIEIPFVPRGFAHHGQDPILQGRHVGMIEVVFAQAGIDLIHVAPATAKKALTGHGRAGVQKMIGDRPGDARARGKLQMMKAAMAIPGWSDASLSIPSGISHMQAAADAVGIAMATMAKVLAAERVAR